MKCSWMERWTDGDGWIDRHLLCDREEHKNTCKKVFTAVLLKTHLFIWLHQVLAAAWELLVMACGI